MIPFKDFNKLFNDYKDVVTCKVYNCIRVKRYDITIKTCAVDPFEMGVLYIFNAIYEGNMYLKQDELLVLPCWINNQYFMRLISKIKDKT